jgi:hypothetical protein
MGIEYIGWGIGILGIIVSVISASKNRQLRDDRRIVNTTAKNIQAQINNPVYNIPTGIKDGAEAKTALTRTCKYCEGYWERTLSATIIGGSARAIARAETSDLFWGQAPLVQGQSPLLLRQNSFSSCPLSSGGIPLRGR